MPSLHIATTAWMMIAIRAFAPRLTVPMAMAAILIFLLSIALGWHYAVDGIVGGAAALIFYKSLLSVFNRSTAKRPPVKAAILGEAQCPSVR